jgi:hypothetical protein
VRVPDDNEGPADHQPSPGLPGGQPPQAPGSPAGHGPPGYPPPGYGQPGAIPPGSGPPGYPPPDYGQQPGYGPPGQAAPGYGPPGYPPPGYGPPGYPPRGYGQQPGYGRPGYPPPGYGQPGAAAPGGIPLRPLNLGDIFNGAVTSARRNPAATFGLAAIVMTIYGVASAVFSVVAHHWEFTAQPGVHTGPAGQLQVLNLTGATAAAIAAFGLFGLSLILTAALTGMLSAVVGRGLLGRKVGLGDAWRAGRTGTVIATTLLLVLIGVAVVVPVVVLTVGLGLAHLAPLAVIVGILGGIATVVLGVLLFVRLSLTLPAVVLERVTPGRAIRRSWELSAGSFWRLFGILLLTSIVVGVAADVITIPFSIIGAIISGDSGGFGLVSLAANTSVVAVIITAIGGILASTVTRPVSAGVSVLLYTDLRMRREGLDLALRTAAGSEGLTGNEFDAAWRPPADSQPGQPAAW